MVRDRSAQPSLLRALAQTGQLGELLPLFHQRAVRAAGGRSSILFQFDRSGEWLEATSGYGLDRLPAEPWRPTGAAAPEVLFNHKGPTFVADLARAGRDLALGLETTSALLIPLAIMDARLGVLAVGCDTPPAETLLHEVADLGCAIALALDRNRAAREADLQQDLNQLLERFSRAVSSSFSLTAGLEVFCAGANRLFAADRSLVWLHDRREGVLTLSAASSPTPASVSRQISATDALAPAAVALRRQRAEITPDRGASPNTGMITIPLKGRRRALGTFVMEDVRLDPGSELGLLANADEMGRQLSSAIENVLLLDDVLRSRRELDNTFNSLADLVIICGRDGRVVHANRAFSARVGKSRDELLDETLDQIVAPATQQLLARCLERTPETGAIRAEIEDPALHGTFQMTVTPLFDEVERLDGAVLVARDITPHAQLEAERAELRDKLVQSEKLAALGQFVAGIAHELNNPLQGVLGHLELMRATGAFPKPLRRDVQRIYREADRAAKIVRNLLVFAGSRRLVRKSVSVNAVLTRVFGLRAPALRAAGIEVVRDRTDAPRVMADPLLLQQAFLNIVLNAEQAIGAHGRIETHKTVLSNPARILIEIRDTGPGLPADVLPRVFEPFYTTKEVGKGTGLGLAIAYGIIQEHGGQISAANHPEGGAVFSVQLPIGDAAEPG